MDNNEWTHCGGRRQKKRPSAQPSCSAPKKAATNGPFQGQPEPKIRIVEGCFKYNISKEKRPGETVQQQYDRLKEEIRQRMMEEAQENVLLQGQENVEDAPPTTPESATAVPPDPAPTSRKIPTIFLDPVPNWPAHAAKMTALTGEDLAVTFRANSYRLKTSTVESFRALQRYLTSENLPFHTFSLRSGRPVRVVISGLPEMSPEELHDELTAKKFAVENVVRLRTSRGITRSWLVTLCPDCEREGEETLPAQDIYRLSTLHYVRVRVAAYRKPRGPPQCYRCQGFGHGSANCGRPIRCVRCGGPHRRNTCTRPAEEKGACCNCSGEHNASYRGCPAYKTAVRASKPAAAQQPSQRRTTSVPEPPTAIDAEQEDRQAEDNEDSEDGFTSVKRKKRKPRNPANRTPRSRSPRRKPAGPSHEPRATPRQRIDWPPKPAAQPVREQEQATPEQPASVPVTAANDVGAIVGQLSGLLQQLTALTGIIAGLVEKMSAAQQTNTA